MGKKHKKELIIAGVSITTIMAGLIGIKKSGVIEAVWKSLRKQIEKEPKNKPVRLLVPVFNEVSAQDIIESRHMAINRLPHNVSEHLRNLSEGYKASQEKISTAAEHGYELLPGQTWVEGYKTGGIVA